MADIGYITLFLALAASLISAIIGILEARSRRPAADGLPLGPLVTFGLVSISSVVLLIAILAHDFSLEYVASYSSRDTSLPYLLSAWWAGNNGSLLFWAWVLALLGVVLAWRQRDSQLLPYASAIVMFAEAFFLILLVSVCNPFEKLAVVPPDGMGLNPLLENPGMVFHPPALLAGYAAMTIPFALAIAALLSGKLDSGWTLEVRRWTLLAWLLLGVGNIIGSWWAYVELGWGGYWAWDPVENAGLMPWLMATAFLHSAMAQRRRGMFKVWNMVLIILAFVLTIFGTLVTRALNLSEAHGFQDQSGLAPFFWAFIGIALVGALGLLYYRRNDLKSEAEVESVVSRETAFLFVNLLLVGSTFTILVGTVFPALSGAFGGTRITVGAPFFNLVNGPIFLGIILLAGFCVLIGWQHKSVGDLARRLLWPLVVALVIAAGLFVAGVREAYAIAAFGLCSLVLFITLQQWSRETKLRHQAKHEGYHGAFWRLLSGNRPHYGGYIVHIGIILMAIGVVGSSFYGVEKEAALKPGESVSINNYRLTYDNMGHSTITQTDLTVTATLSVYNGDKLLGKVTPEKYFKQNYDQPVSEVAIRSNLVEDLYVILLGWDQSGSVTFRVLVNPLVAWIWVGGVVLGIGGLVAFWPERRRVPMAAAEDSATAEGTEEGPPKGVGFCPRCGARREAGDRFCARCGARLRG